MRFTGVPEPADQHIPGVENTFKCLFFIFMIATGFIVAQASAEYFDELQASSDSHTLVFLGKWAVLGLIAVVNCSFLLGIGILAHDALHKVLFKNKFWNEFAGGLLSGFALLPFCTNRQFHLTHHSLAHQPGKDPENKFHDKPYYTALLFGAFFALIEQYKLLVSNAVNRFSEPKFRLRVLRDISTTIFVALVYFHLLPKAGLNLAYTVIPLIVMLPVVFSYRAISDHYGLPAINRASLEKSDIDPEKIDQWHKNNNRMQNEISGWVVLTHPVIEWLWSNVNYHEVHHKFPYLSYKYLPQAFRATRDLLPYAVRHGYTASLLSLRKSKYYSSPGEVQEYLTMPERNYQMNNEASG